MTAIKSLWAAVQGDPKLMRRVNGLLTLFWVAMIPVSMVMGWLSSVVYVSALSLWALVSGHWSAWQAARVEVNQQRAEQEAARTDLPTEVADQVITRTGLTPTPVSSDRKVPPGPTTAAPATAAIAAARKLVMNRCHLDTEQALTHLANYATLTELSLDAAARQLLRSVSAADPRPPHTAADPRRQATTRTDRLEQHHPPGLASPTALRRSAYNSSAP